MIRRTFLALAFAASTALLGQANADTLYVGSPHGSSVTLSGGSKPGTHTGGNFQNSKLNGNSLPFLYCVDLDHTTSVPATYNNTTVTIDGKIHGSLVGNADKIGYLVANYGAAAVSAGKATAMQAAIWQLEYGGTVTAIGGGGTLADVATYLGYATSASAGDRAKVYWLSPKISGSSTKYQGMVSIAPEPSSLAIAGLAGLGMLAMARKRRSR